VRVRDLALKRGEPIAIPREHRNRISAAREAASDRRSCSRTYPGHDCNWIIFIH
jgi:hypothetical protein